MREGEEDALLFDSSCLERFREDPMIGSSLFSSSPISLLSPSSEVFHFG